MIISEKTTLYKRDKTGKIVSYRILVKHSKQVKGAVELIKQTGKLDGKKVRHEKIIDKGKNIGRSNETTPTEQAISEMESDWKKKKDEGYKSITDLGIQHKIDPSNKSNLNFYVWQHLYGTLQEILHEALPKSNTDSRGLPKPMLANPIEKIDKSKLVFPAYVQPKLDGVRCLAIINSEGVKLLSRGGKYYMVPPVIANLKSVMKKFITEETPEIILDGEIYNHEMEFEDISSAVKSTKSETFKLKFCVYDLAVEGMTFSQRFQKLSLYLGGLNEEHLVLVPTFPIKNFKQIGRFHERCIEENYEGAMYRTPAGEYQFGARSNNLLKIKIFDEDEYPLVKFDISGHRGVQDIKAVCQKGDKTFSAPMNGTLAHKTQLYQDYKDGKIKKGDLVTVEYFGLTLGGTGVPRFPKGKTIRNYE